MKFRSVTKGFLALLLLIAFAPAFAAGLEYAHSTFFPDESLDRQAVWDAYDGVILADGDPAEELDFAVQTGQAGLDEFWAERE